MTPEEFGELLDACGSAPESWPPGARAGARRLLASAQEARDALKAQETVDRWLDASRADGPLPDFAARSMERPQRPQAPLLINLVTGRAGVAAAAAAALFTVGLGTATGLAYAGASEPAQALAAALSTSGDAIDAD